MVVSDKKQITAHYLRFWGVPSSIEIVKDESIAILEFDKSERRESFLYATNGASTHGIEAGGVIHSLELYASSLVYSASFRNLLVVMARYLRHQNTFFDDFDSIPVGVSLEGLNSDFRSLMVIPPFGDDGHPLGVCTSNNEQVIRVSQVVGIFESELRYAEKYGGRELWEILKAVPNALSLDVERHAVI